MKIQSLAVIFAIIILPVIIILSYYIQSSIDTIALQTSYDTKLIDSTHDAMASFEINTANENLSSVADSLRSIIDASTNVFFNTLATNLGMSNANREYVQSYVPAILYTLYDGYYIYSPTRVPKVLTAGDEQVVYVGDRGLTNAGDFIETETNKKIGKYEFDEAEYEKDLDVATKENEATKSIRQANLYNGLPTDRKYEYGQMLYENEDGTYSTEINENTVYTQNYVLKSYMPYSARYLENPDKMNAEQAFDLTINYTLDNYLTIEGYIGDVYYSKTGYLIAKDVVKSIAVSGATDLLTYNEDDAEAICLSGQYNLNLRINPIMEDGVTRTSSEIEISYEPWVEDGVALNSIQLQEKLDRLYEENSDLSTIQELETRLANLNAITYYAKAQIFSNWIYENLGTEGGLEIKASNIARDIADLNSGIFTSEDDMDLLYNFSENDKVLFDASVNPEKEDSPFYSHKLDVMRNAIQYNLNLAISSYDVMVGEMDIKMPVMSDDEWDKILNNVSVTAFMQGLNCGMKIYNNYAIVSSTNNELTVIANEIYYTQKSEFNTADTSHLYHRIDCEELTDGEYVSFKSKEIKYDKIYDKTTQKYKYDHRNNGCYSCIITGNHLKQINAAGEMGYSDEILVSTLSPTKQKAYYIAVAKERQNLYKSNALTESNGYEVLFTSSSDNSNHVVFGSGNAVVELPLENNSAENVNKIKTIEVTIRDIQSGNKNEATAAFHGIINGVEVGENLVVNLEQATPQTISIPVHIEQNSKLSSLRLMKMNPDDEVECNILSVRGIYE